MKIVAVIVVRKGSKRILNKSKKKINNITLIERKISQLKKVKKIKKIYLGTNDLSLKKLTKKYNINFVQREDKYCNEKKTDAKKMVKNMLQYVNGDIILWAHPTNPFVDEKFYTGAISLFLKSMKKYDSVFSVTEIRNHFWSHIGKPINHNPSAKKHVVASKLEPVLGQNGAIFIRHKKDMIKDGSFIGKKPKIFKMNEIIGWDLDHPWQLDLARALVKYKYVK